MKEAKFRCIKTINTENHSIFSISWSPEGKRLAVGFDYEDIEIYDIDSCKCLQSFKEEYQHFIVVTWSPDGNTIATASYDYYPKIWDVSNGQCIKILYRHRGYVHYVDF